MKNKLQTVVIILNYNGEHLLKENIPSVLAQSVNNYKIIIVDSFSTDNSVNYIKSLSKKNPQIDTLFLEKNLGYAGGNNEGIDFAIKKYDPEYFVILNNDVKVEHTWLEELISGFQLNPKIALCTSLLYLYFPYKFITISPKEDFELEGMQFNKTTYHVLYFQRGKSFPGSLVNFPFKLASGESFTFGVPLSEDKEHLQIKYNGNLINETEFTNGTIEISPGTHRVVQNAGSLFNPKTMTFHDRGLFSVQEFKKNEVIAAASGASMAIRSDILKKLGAFKAEYFMYYEDSELSYRYKKNGFDTLFVHSSIGYHRFWGSNAGKETKTQIYFGTRNRLWFIRYYFGLGVFLKFYIRHVGRTILSTFNGILGEKRSRLSLLSYIRILLTAWV